MTAKMLRLTRRYLHLGRIVPEVEPELDEMLTNKEVDVKLLRTRRHIGIERLPALLESAAKMKIRQVSDKKFRAEARALMSILHNIKKPDDDLSIKLQKAEIFTELEIRDKIKDRPEYDPFETELTFKEDKDLTRHRLSQLIQGKVDERRRDWHYYEYDDYASCLYMGTRLTPNYAVLRTVMKEIQATDLDYQPKSVLDFGSGMGTTIWAVEETWPQSVREFLNIEISKDQQDLCEFLLRKGSETGGSILNVYHRQYLPSSNKIQYDMVVSAFSMLELPTMELRINTIENLWHKTNDLLVLIERGNRGGFSVLYEARNLLLDLGGHKVTRRIPLTFRTMPTISRDLPIGHVIAPCSHDFHCPRTDMRSKKRMDECRFSVSYDPLEIGMRAPGTLKEEFSYLVMRKGAHPSYKGEAVFRYPRVVEPTKRRGGHTRVTVCCPNGHLAETVITKAKYGQSAREIAKSCKWGDLLPVIPRDNYRKKSELTNSNKVKTTETSNDDSSKSCN